MYYEKIQDDMIMNEVNIYYKCKHFKLNNKEIILTHLTPNIFEKLKEIDNQYYLNLSFYDIENLLYLCDKYRINIFQNKLIKSLSFRKEDKKKRAKDTILDQNKERAEEIINDLQLGLTDKGIQLANELIAFINDTEDYINLDKVNRVPNRRKEIMDFYKQLTSPEEAEEIYSCYLKPALNS